MTLIIDTGPLVALGDEVDPRRAQVRHALQSEWGRLIIPAPIVTEADYLLGRRVGCSSRIGFLTDLANGLFEVECLLPMEYEMILRLDQQYADLDVGLADLSIVVLARRILTCDERHFRTLRPLDDGAFTLLPSDDG